MRAAARLGHAAKGFLYVLLGALAALEALGLGGRTASPTEALSTVRGTAAGMALLWVTAVGLAAYALWAVFSAVADAEGFGTDGAGIARRAGTGVGAIVYGGLAVSAFHLVTSIGAASNDGGAQPATEALLGQPAGPWLVGTVALVLALYALFQLSTAVTAAFMRRLSLAGAMSGRRELVKRIGQVGISARAAALLLIAGFLLRAAIDENARRARGLEGSLETLKEQPYGRWLLLALAAGLVAYGVYSVIRGLYMRIHA